MPIVVQAHATNDVTHVRLLCRYRKKEKADYSAPVSFVSKGVPGGAGDADKEEVRARVMIVCT